MSICKITAIIVLGLMSAGCATSPEMTSAMDEPKSPMKKSKSSAPAVIGEVQVPTTPLAQAVEPLPITYVEVEMPRIATQIVIAPALALEPATIREVAPAPIHRSMQPIEDDHAPTQKKWEWVEKTPPSAPSAPVQTVAAPFGPNSQNASLVASLAPLPIEALP